MLCSSIPDENAASVIILYTPFCEIMVSTTAILVFQLVIFFKKMASFIV